MPSRTVHTAVHTLVHTLKLDSRGVWKGHIYIYIYTVHTPVHTLGVLETALNWSFLRPQTLLRPPMGSFFCSESI